MKWLTDELKNEIKKVFEPRYHRTLSDQEITSIASTISSLMTVMLTYPKKGDKQNG
jgi:mono/diheme cytochrome c family protein